MSVVYLYVYNICDLIIYIDNLYLFLCIYIGYGGYLGLQCYLHVCLFTVRLNV